MSGARPPDPVELTRALVRAPSVTPEDAGAMDIVEERLRAIGFSCRRLSFWGIENLYARWGTTSPNLCFAGHTDVVPPGDPTAWAHPPFDAVVADGVLTGRGAADMKSAVAAFICAASEAIEAASVPGSLSLLITGDEEGIAEHGTKAVVAHLHGEGEVIDHCLVGEPTSAERLGDMIKIGRRGSVSAEVVVDGLQGHVAYPDRAANPIPVLLRFLSAVQGRVLDRGFEEFQASNLEVTTIDVGNPAGNVIPAQARARLNIRFNPAHTGASLAAWLEAEGREAAKSFDGSLTVTPRISGEAFLTRPGPFTEVVAGAVAAVCGVEPSLSTTGGTSDARFIRAVCPVVEFGLVGSTMHKTDECVPISEIVALRDVYVRLIGDYFSRFAA